MSDLRNITIRQKELLAELENEVKHIENSDLTKENARLKAELEKLNIEYEKSAQAAESLSQQNTGLKNALYEQVYNEKVKIVHTTKEKLEIYFKSLFEGQQNRLSALECSIKSRIEHMTNALHENNVGLDTEISRKLGELAEQVNVQITETRARYAQTHGAFSENEHDEFERLKQELTTESQILAITKKNNVERFVGLNLLNIIGILLIIIGVITAAHYTYVQLPDTLKGVMMFVLGAIMLAAGELLNRKKPNVFSLGITAGGVGVLYTALAISYFGLEILGMYPALALCALITAVTFILSTRYNSQTILAIALVGGYLPLFSIIDGNSLPMLYGAMAYFVVLNLLALMVAFKRKWTIATYVGMSLNIIATVVISVIMSSSDIKALLHNKFITVAYVMFAFLVYSAVPIISTYKERLRFKKSDAVLLSINTFFSSLIMYLLFYSFSWNDATGLLSIAFAAIYLLLGHLLEKNFSGEKHVQALFYLTGLTFVVLIIPFQFGSAWLTLGWLAQGVALTTYGILKEQKHFKIAGYIINGLCMWAFLFLDLTLRVNFLFSWKYFAVTIGSLIILGAYMYKKTLSSGWQKTYKCIAIINLWIYALYICSELNDLLYRVTQSAQRFYNIDYLVSALAILLTFSIAYAAPRIKVLSDIGTKIISIILYILGLFWLFGLNSWSTPYYAEAPLGVAIIGSAALALISLLSVFAVSDFIKLIVLDRKLGVEWYPLIVSLYFIIILTQNLIAQYALSFASAWLSIVYILTALAWILFGFVKRYSFIRRAGLGLSLFAVAKLFLVDLAVLTQGYRIISYFALGVSLVAISFVYQYFSKRLELKIGVESDVEQSDVSENN
ncbi:MAG: DUF2339 domain-containing protein [Oscillospiraceae bacterium]|nr:DUF2339 domain-containing protein [Oscillospiraceae bacterium]